MSSDNHGFDAPAAIHSELVAIRNTHTLVEAA